MALNTISSSANGVIPTSDSTHADHAELLEFALATGISGLSSRFTTGSGVGPVGLLGAVGAVGACSLQSLSSRGQVTTSTSETSDVTLGTRWLREREASKGEALGWTALGDLAIARVLSTRCTGVFGGVCGMSQGKTTSWDSVSSGGLLQRNGVKSLSKLYRATQSCCLRSRGNWLGSNILASLAHLVSNSQAQAVNVRKTFKQMLLHYKQHVALLTASCQHHAQNKRGAKRKTSQRKHQCHQASNGGRSSWHLSRSTPCCPVFTKPLWCMLLANPTYVTD